MKRLLQLINEEAQSDILPFHMPGHKRKNLTDADLPYAKDMTESTGMVDLYAKEGWIAERQMQCAQQHSAFRSYFLINGSTSGILSAIYALCPPHSPLLMARNAHRSAYHAIEIQQSKPIFLPSAQDKAWMVSADIAPSDVETMLVAHPEIRTVYITSPTYEGIVSDVRSIAAICHAHHAILIVDQAHGAHFAYTAHLPSAIREGADVVIESLHKTLPALTPAALLHISERAPVEKIEHALCLFQTSSPSHIVLASIDECLHFMNKNSNKIYRRLYAQLDAFYEKAKTWNRLELFCPDGQHDRSKILLRDRDQVFSGVELAYRLREMYRIECEMTYGSYVLLMATLADDAESLNQLQRALDALDAHLVELQNCPQGQDAKKASSSQLKKAHGEPITAIHTEIAYSIQQARNLPWEPVSAPHAIGRIAADYLWCYPPGIPLLIPGERITDAHRTQWEYLQQCGSTLRSFRGEYPAIACIKESSSC